MRKTSVYLTEDEAEGLRRLAVREGRPQAELLRQGVRQILAEADARPRAFRSLGAGRSSGRKAARWSSAEVYRKALGGA